MTSMAGSRGVTRIRVHNRRGFTKRDLFHRMFKAEHEREAAVEEARKAGKRSMDAHSALKHVEAERRRDQGRTLVARIKAFFTRKVW